MRALVIYSHPVPESFNAAVRDTVMETLNAAGHETRLLDLHAMGFDPVLGTDERRRYHDAGVNEDPVREHLDHILWAEMLVFVYPTWWYGLPAMLKGWLDRVWVPHVTFIMPDENTPLRPNMTHIRKIAAISTCGAPWWLLMWMRHPGKNTILRGIRALCHPSCKTLWVAHYLMDSSTQKSRTAFLEKIRGKLRVF